MAYKDQLAKFTRLAPGEQNFLIASMMALPVAWMVLRIFRLPTVLRWLSHARDPRIEATHEEVERLAELMKVAARRSFGATCLTQSLALAWMLKRRHIHVEIQIGVRLSGQKLDAHAWVEFLGRPVGDRADLVGQFTPFEPLPVDLPVSR